MPDKSRKQDDPAQSKRFIEAAKNAEADESEEGAEQAFRKVTKSDRKKRKAISNGDSL